MKPSNPKPPIRALPDNVVIAGIEYQIIYVDNPAETDPHKREAAWGSCDYWTRTIRIYKDNRQVFDIYQTILHEVIHALADEYKIKILEDEENHDQLDILATVLLDTMVRNKWLTLKDD